MIKILVDGMPKEIGGIGTFLLNIANQNFLGKNSIDINFSFLIPENSKYQELLNQINCKTYIVPSLKKIFSYKKVIKGLFRECSFDFIWINNTSKVNRVLIKLAKNRGIKIISHPHGVDNEEKYLKKIVFHLIERLNERFYLSAIDIPLACSEEAAKVYYKYDLDLLNKSVVIKNGINTFNFKFSDTSRNIIREKLSILSDEILLGTVGRMTEVKNHTFLIDVIYNLPKNYKLIILGDGDDKEKITKKVEEMGLEGRIILPGQVNNVNDYLAAMDLFVLPSLHEGMPYAVIEAQSEGLPCVISDSVSKEVKITDLVFFAKLNSKNDWIKKILLGVSRINASKRERYSEIINDSGFSIEKSFLLFKSILDRFDNNGNRVN